MVRYITLCFLLLFTLFPTKSNAQPSETEDPPIILILDGSGSMWGQLEGETKISIARKVVGNLLDNMDSTQAIGLVAYGHRQKGDCEDIENILDPSTGNHDAIKAALNNINPVGMTPLANTALKVIEKLKTEGGSATIILVSDGAESCGGDLCAVVKAAKEAGVDFILHIVGFDIGESDKLALECAAQAGEGVYLDASNGDELSAALEQATEITVEIEEPVAEGTPTLSVKVTKDDALHDAVVKIFRPDEEKYFTSKRSYDHEAANPAMFPLDAGTYHVNVALAGKGKDTEEQWRNDVVVVAGDTTELEFDFTAGKISIQTTANEELWDCVVHIKKAGETAHAAGGRTYKSETSNPMIKELTPGYYDVDISAMKLKGANIKKSFENVEVLPGEKLELEYNFDYGELSIKATNNGELWDCVINTFQTGDERKSSLGGGRTYNSVDHNPFTQLYTPGKYSVEYSAHHIHGAEWKHVVENLEVKAGEKTAAVHDYQTGIVRIEAKHEGELWKVGVNMNQDGRSVFSKRLPSTKITDINMTPGTYEVTVKPVKLEAVAQNFTITVVAGETIEKVLQF